MRRPRDRFGAAFYGRSAIATALVMALVMATTTCGPRRGVADRETTPTTVSEPAPGTATATPTATQTATPTATPTPIASTPTSSPTDSTSAEQACVDGINGYRATLHLPPLARWNTAESCADGEARSDSKSREAHGAFGHCEEMAQNECPGWPGPPTAMIGDCLKMMWAEGPGGGHYENMRAGYTQVSCGFATAADGSLWSVQNFR